MDAAQLRAHLAKEREFDFPGTAELGAEGKSFRLRWLTDKRIRQIGGEIGELRDRLLEEAIIGWSGFTLHDLSPSLPDTPLAFDRSLIEEVCNRFRRFAAAAYRECDRRFAEAEANAEAERKN